MAEAIKYSKTGEELGKIELSKILFEAEAKNSEALLYEVVKMYLANQRQGTSSVKNRANVQSSGKKMYRQKGTGSARAGSRRSPIRVGGGNAFGPRPKNWYSKIPKKKKRLALKLALTQKAEENNVIVIENLDYDKPSTKKGKELLSKIANEQRQILFVIEDSDKNLIRSFSNISNVTMDRADGLFAYEIINSSCIVLTEDALKKIGEVFEK
ncbi:MAG: 50S ribosomal protein L4 [Candidatus Cloacimonadota bacterium]|nr:50S ribosomal protein L4 [Candidatus Cloacimonadota bacterium]